MKPRHAHSALSPDLKVRVDRIPEEGLELDEPMTAEWLNGTLGGSPFRAARPGRLRLSLSLVERAVHVRGRASVSLEGPCVRCLGPVSLALDVPIEVVVFPSGAEPAAGPEGELQSDDMGVATYDEETIELAGLVRDEVFLELPMSPVCAESCAGLCPRCGTNLNETRCACAPEADPRWQALAGLKID
jgi:uncharacterized protein